MVYITAVHMSEGGTRHEHVASVRWKNPADGATGDSTRATMVDWIKNKGGDARVRPGRSQRAGRRRRSQAAVHSHIRRQSLDRQPAGAAALLTPTAESRRVKRERGRRGEEDIGCRDRGRSRHPHDEPQTRNPGGDRRALKAPWARARGRAALKIQQLVQQPPPGRQRGPGCEIRHSGPHQPAREQHRAPDHDW